MPDTTPADASRQLASFRKIRQFDACANPDCGKPFESLDPRARFCSAVCRWHVRYLNTKASKKREPK